MNDCIFCKIINKEIPSKMIYEDENVISFYDIAPKAPVHFLVVPKEHIASTDMINEENSAIISNVFEVIAILSKQLNLKDGYRVINNCGLLAGQTIPHIHFHILAGKELDW